MQIRVSIVLLVVLISCKNKSEMKTDKAEIIIDSTDLKIKTNEKKEVNLRLNFFLENPINFQEFKTIKNRKVTTSVTNGTSYYFNPKFTDSIFYGYNFVTENIGENGVNEIIVFKYGENKHKYADETETLIEMRIFNKDSDLGSANLIGRSKAALESEFGTDYLNFESGIAYAIKNKILIIELDNSKVKSFRYIKLNTGHIDQSLIQQIME